MKKSSVIVLLIFISAYTSAQHRGDNLTFQGINLENSYTATSLGMGNTSVSVPGKLSAIFSNPAGLAGLNRLEISIDGMSSERNWRENQDYRPNRFFVTLPFYLEGLYVPLPENNYRWDYEIARDSTHFVNLPQLGLDPFSEEASDWKNNMINSGLINVAAAYPFSLAEMPFVVSAAYTRNLVTDYDRNDTYLEPHPGFDLYGEIGKVDGLDTLVVRWSDFRRSRSGFLNNIYAAASVELNEYVSIGFGGVYTWGSTDDFQSLSRIGSFDLIRENRFRFYYQDQLHQYSGTSEFSAVKLNTGFLINLNRFTFGISINLPYTLKRDWSYTELQADSSGSNFVSIGGSDEADIPAVYSIGVSIKPLEDLIVSFDLVKGAYSKTVFSISMADSFFNSWPDQNIVRLGAEYKASDLVTLRAGYRNIPQLFIPDGAAVNDEGPVAESFTGGLGLNFFFGSIDLAFEYGRLKYYDSYYSNTNYVYENNYRLLAGYTYSF